MLCFVCVVPFVICELPFGNCDCVCGCVCVCGLYCVLCVMCVCVLFVVGVA